MRITTPVAICLSFFAAIAEAQSDIIPLNEYSSLPEEDQVTTYPFVRCIGLYKGMMQYGGANIDEQAQLAYDQMNYEMVVVSALIRQREQPSFGTEAHLTQIGREVDDMTNIFAERFRNNYARTGQAFGGDALVNSDLPVCKALSEAAHEAANR